MLAYTAPKNGEPSEFIGVIKARHFEYEQMTFDELKWIIHKLRSQSKDPENISILNERYNHLNFIAKKRTEKGRRSKKAQDKRDQVTNQSTLTEIFPENAPQPNNNSEIVSEEATKTVKMGRKSKKRIITQPLPPETNARVRRRSSGIMTNIQDWNEYKKNNW